MRRKPTVKVNCRWWKGPLVRHGHFKSRTKMVQSPSDPPQPKTPSCCTQTWWLSLLQNRTYRRSKFYIEGKRNFAPFLLLWPWPWFNDLHIRTWPVSPQDVPADQRQTFYVNAFESYRQTDVETDTNTYITTSLHKTGSVYINMRDALCSVKVKSYHETIGNNLR